MLQDLNNLGEEIKSRVDDAIRRSDFSDLSRSIGDVINNGIESAKQAVYGTGNNKNVVYDAQYREVKNEEPQLPAHPLYEKRPRKLGTMLATGFGFTFGFIFAVAALVLLIVTLAHVGSFFPLTGVFAGISAVSFVTANHSVRKLRLLSRYYRYIPMIKDKLYVPLAPLAETVRLPMTTMLKDLKYFQKNNWLLESHVEEKDGYLIMSDEAYREYKDEKAAYKKRAEELEARQRMDHLSDECQKIIREGEEYVNHIRHCNDEIPDAEISRKLDHMEKVVARIFEELRVHPEVSGDLGRLMNYYLPTTAKLLDAYRELDKQPITGANITDTKREISMSLDTLNVAFEKLLDSLFADRAMDISTDISVLNTILAQEGLKEGGLTSN